MKTIPVIASPFEILEYCIALPSLSFLLSLTAQCHIKKATDQMLYEIFNFRQRNTRTEKLKSKKIGCKKSKNRKQPKKETESIKSVVEIKFAQPYCCVFPMAISSKFRMRQHMDVDHQENAPHFITTDFFLFFSVVKLPIFLPIIFFRLSF